MWDPALAGLVRLKADPYSWANGLLLALIERQRNDARTRPSSANVHIESGAWRRVLDGQIGHADRFLQVRRPRAARDLTNRRCAGRTGADVVSMPGDARVDHFEPDELSA